MEARAAAIAAGEAGELVWLLEHPPLYTAGVSAKAADLLDARFPVFESGRGGQYTYHGPGQRVAYVMLDLRARDRDVGAFVRALEAWVIDALATFNVEGLVRPRRVGVWVEHGTPRRESKIAAIGVKLRRWVSFHGISLNVEPDLSHFDGIVPCGVREHGVTSLVDLGLPVTMDEADAALKDELCAGVRRGQRAPELNVSARNEPAPVTFMARTGGGMLNEFKEFIMRGNVVDLAVGVIIGAAFGTIVDSLVNDVLTPPIGMLTGGVDFSNLRLVLAPENPATPAVEEVAIRYGAFITALVSF
jgi:lipoyl(octanoyl) transferase